MTAMKFVAAIHITISGICRNTVYKFVTDEIEISAYRLQEKEFILKIDDKKLTTCTVKSFTKANELAIEFAKLVWFYNKVLLPIDLDVELNNYNLRNNV